MSVQQGRVLPTGRGGRAGVLIPGKLWRIWSGFGGNPSQRRIGVIRTRNAMSAATFRVKILAKFTFTSRYKVHFQFPLREKMRVRFTTLKGRRMLNSNAERERGRERERDNE